MAVDKFVIMNGSLVYAGVALFCVLLSLVDLGSTAAISLSLPANTNSRAQATIGTVDTTVSIATLSTTTTDVTSTSTTLDWDVWAEEG